MGVLAKNRCRWLAATNLCYWDCRRGGVKYPLCARSRRVRLADRAVALVALHDGKLPIGTAAIKNRT